MSVQWGQHRGNIAFFRQRADNFLLFTSTGRPLQNLVSGPLCDANASVLITFIYRPTKNGIALLFESSVVDRSRVRDYDKKHFGDHQESMSV